MNATNLETYYKLIEVKGITLPKESSEVLSNADQAKIKEMMLYYAEKLPRVNSHLRVGIRYL